MATGGKDDPLKPNRKSPSQDELHTDPEEEVVQEAEAVFCSYVRYRYHQEMEQGEQSTPNPEIVALQPDESSPMCRVGQQLAIIGDDINRRYDFSGMLSQLALTPDNAYDYFCKIANRNPLQLSVIMPSSTQSPWLHSFYNSLILSFVLPFNAASILTIFCLLLSYASPALVGMKVQPV
ncbi:bcl-2 homologous antagonist/killer isoform X3 [Paramormyrops kingsleyae]|uniref:bcl-2 homologous antagonist/killer isoform X3 n=1 Tax=Paramormyrops kingsleyae TaxID=1676925 RepID=UPI000CD5DD44|nr:bcl-2 homologous antagonist/killer isoform X3 [Paramormyrops kingsleyae]